MEVLNRLKNEKDIIGWVRQLALPPKDIRHFEITDMLIIATFRSDERYLLRFRVLHSFGGTVLRVINGWLIQNLCDRISSYTLEEFTEKTGWGTTLEIYQYKQGGEK
ncbi:MAG: hypothetical protein DDT23_00045 [candidate division WS2 bacterium]|nr:hypothetical protein [Candidatus Lithacetigena glycinireducens]